MSTSYYDIVVIGTELPGLIYGALAARAGYRILVVGQDGISATYQMGDSKGLRLLPILYGFESSMLMRNVFRDLGLYQEMVNRPTREEPGFQAVSPGVWADFSGRDKLLRRTIELEFPKDNKDIQSFFEMVAVQGRAGEELLSKLPPLPPDGYFARRGLKKLLRELDPDNRMEQKLEFPDNLDFYTIMTGLASMMTNLRLRPANPYTMARLLHHAMSGFWSYPGGTDGFRELFVDRYTARGGVYKPQSSASGILVKGKTAQEVLLARGQEQVSFRAMICNCPVKSFFNLIAPESQHQDVSALLSTLEATHARYVVNMMIPDQLLPQALHRHLLVIGSNRRELQGENFLWLYRNPPERGKEDGPAVLSVFTHIPMEDLPTAEEEFEALNLRILSTLRGVIPFADPGSVTMNTPYLTRSRELGKMVLDPREIQPVYSKALEDTLELSPIPFITGYKNILILGDEIYSGLGLEGAFLAASQAIQWTTENIKLKKIKGT